MSEVSVRGPHSTGSRIIASSRLKFSFLICIALVCIALVCLAACAAPAPVREPAPDPQQPAIATSTPRPAMLPPATGGDVSSAVARVFKDNAVLDTSRSPNFVVGDFNGDQSQDIAVVLRPAPAKLAEMNESLPPWILRDPFAARKPLLIAADELLLAIIHGYGTDGWRDPQATQTYLLKNAVGPRVETRPMTEFVNANQGKSIPRVRGDLIAEVLNGTSGFLYYDEATYSWYDPRTFKLQPVRQVVHPGIMRKQ